MGQKWDKKRLWDKKNGTFKKTKKNVKFYAKKSGLLSHFCPVFCPIKIGKKW